MVVVAEELAFVEQAPVVGGAERRAYVMEDTARFLQTDIRKAFMTGVRFGLWVGRLVRACARILCRHVCRMCVCVWAA